jgi:biopolymer transport protein ExbD
MKIPVRERESGVRFNITPLIDICFNLIVFFSLASLAAKKDASAAVVLPQAGQIDGRDIASARRLVVTMDAKRRVFVAGQETSPNDFERLVAERAGDQPAGCEVRVRADESVPYSDVKPLILACARHGVTNLKFAVRGK